jgi:hypothetical protein
VRQYFGDARLFYIIATNLFGKTQGFGRADLKWFFIFPEANEASSSFMPSAYAANKMLQANARFPVPSLFLHSAVFQHAFELH